jgi:hypothetical protein
MNHDTTVSATSSPKQLLFHLLIIITKLKLQVFIDLNNQVTVLSSSLIQKIAQIVQYIVFPSSPLILLQFKK